MLVRQRLCEEGRTLPTHRSLFSLEGPPPATPSTRPLGKIPTCRPDQPSRETSGLLISCIMNWHMIISALIVVVLKIVGMTLFLLYFPQIFGENNAIFIPTESSGTVPQILGNGTVSFTPTESYGTVCPKGWDFHQGRCFFLSKSESSWNKSMNFCKEKGSTLAIVNTPEKMKFLQDITGAEKYFIGLLYQPVEKTWHWINNTKFNGKKTSSTDPSQYVGKRREIHMCFNLTRIEP
ncbi:C-type lectin domain family 5 member A isoform X2 [Bubalus bubalis]|uniref:C-type lectin domain family 5 member A isoform X2 n=1 Tax=Bubalus bubalis TaxID=89462 RepID=UPI001D0FDB19|nr:C-type lectin domain family 5 member A isoform X2 [Bubalus bubalis]